MSCDDKPPALAIFAHPGHELRALHALHELDARIVFLTDASASTGESRLHLSDATLAGAEIARHCGFEPLPDRALYNALLDRDAAVLERVLTQLTSLIAREVPALLITDSAEGYNPAHDLCHFLVLAAAQRARLNAPVFDIALNDDPSDFAHARPRDCRVFDLDAQDQARKLAAIEDYTERAGPFLRREAVELLDRYGAAGQAREILRPALGFDAYLNAFSGTPPFFERHGRARVAEGKYKQALTLETHLQPVLETLLSPVCVS
ncbi:hypothetical protein [Hyphobacterium marinum]|uniref:LmbE family protein n=1 Tax=Hyphobacterium marinum TaxID=3116574 RepID=A0ABU7LUN1_9PROT|nr:hypothetical protein [Hyphobacterium sp. Y6023]MEE2565259.1 hypothetical protein [Hyphobacterium sp. Y6023]